LILLEFLNFILINEISDRIYGNDLVEHILTLRATVRFKDISTDN